MNEELLQKLISFLWMETFKPRSAEKLANDPNTRRNFFAPSGMENNPVYVKKDNDGKLVFKYREELYSVIDEFMYKDGM